MGFIDEKWKRSESLRDCQPIESEELQEIPFRLPDFRILVEI